MKRYAGLALIALVALAACGGKEKPDFAGVCEMFTADPAAKGPLNKTKMDGPTFCGCVDTFYQTLKLEDKDEILSGLHLVTTQMTEEGKTLRQIFSDFDETLKSETASEEAQAEAEAAKTGVDFLEDLTRDIAKAGQCPWTE